MAPAHAARLVAVLVVLGVLGIGCSSSEVQPPAAKRAELHGKISTQADGALAGLTDGTATPSTTIVADPKDTAPQASDVLDQFLDALAAKDLQRAGELSIGAVQYFTFIRSLLAAHADAAGTSIEYRYTDRELTQGSPAGDRRPFSGRAVLHGTATFAGGRKLDTSEELGDPVVRAGTNGPHVADFRYQGQPLVLSPGGAAQSLRSGVQVRMVGALSQGDATAVVLQLVGAGEVSVSIEDSALVYPDAEAKPAAQALVGSYVYAAFPRRVSPTAYRARFSLDGGPSQSVSLAF
ncbi:MAG: hypothetical protein QOE35_293 [Actinomycetota bacterium]|jgi:hypothetical protein